MSLQKSLLAVWLLFAVVWVNFAIGDDGTIFRRAFDQSCRTFLNSPPPPGDLGEFCRLASETFLRALRSFTVRDAINTPLATRQYFSEYFRVTFFPEKIVDDAVFFGGGALKLLDVMTNKDVPFEGLHTIYGTRIMDRLYRFGVQNWCSARRDQIYVNDRCDRKPVAYQRFWDEAGYLLASRTVGKGYYIATKGHFTLNGGFSRELEVLLGKRSRCTALTMLNVVKPDQLERHSCEKSWTIRKLRGKIAGSLLFSCADYVTVTMEPTPGLVEGLRDVFKRSIEPAHAG